MQCGVPVDAPGEEALHGIVIRIEVFTDYCRVLRGKLYPNLTGFIFCYTLTGWKTLRAFACFISAYRVLINYSIMICGFLPLS